ncbi:predicted protein [Plenodomus lingam JN3]|uniref:Predicted protein n=1 Tax=Leptosphaeria maculans (strain JN3 / isolate v23.1.3 / race Av1-4-5-6-7-8) TaxID=985895 RepID=E4ZR77_LEPMJ|nr:predicted protein [Plenodomus lingam JN3]CBX93742.1 predicted protein [Plenodomus lingam JN3]
MGTRISTTSHVILPLGVALSAINSANQNTTEVPLSLNGALQGLEQEFADTVWKTGSGLHNLINGSYSAQDIGRTVPFHAHRVGISNGGDLSCPGHKADSGEIAGKGPQP